MSMSKQDFIALANALNTSRPPFSGKDGRLTQWSQDVETIRQVCAASNPNFKSDRWLGYIAGTNGPSGKVLKT